MGCQVMISLCWKIYGYSDVYDALISERVYKRAFSHEEAVTIIAQGLGSHFDPDICRTFLRIADRFYEIAVAFKDTERGVYAHIIENKLI